MSSTHLMIAAALLAASCSERSARSKGGDGVDWSKIPTKHLVTHIGDIPYTIDLLIGADIGGGDMVIKEYDASRHQYGTDVNMVIGDVSVEVSVANNTATKNPTLDNFASSHPRITNWVHKEPRADGFVASYENEAFPNSNDYLVRAETGSGKNQLACLVRVTLWTKSNDTTVIDKLPFVEKMCASIKPGATS